MKTSIMDAYNEMSKAKYEAEDALNKLEQTKQKYFEAKMNECIKDMLKIQEEEGKLTERDFKIFLSDLITNVVSHSR